MVEVKKKSLDTHGPVEDCRNPEIRVSGHTKGDLESFEAVSASVKVRARIAVHDRAEQQQKAQYHAQHQVAVEFSPDA